MIISINPNQKREGIVNTISMTDDSADRIGRLQPVVPVPAPL